MPSHRHGPHHPPRSCPVCGDDLTLTRLSCISCGTELSGDFEQCRFCALGAEDRALLEVFLSSRGNLREVERHLGVSYPTARARFEALLGRLGLEPKAPPGDEDEPAPSSSTTAGSGRRDPASEPKRLNLLEELAKGAIDVAEALKRLQ